MRIMLLVVALLGCGHEAAYETRHRLPTAQEADCMQQVRMRCVPGSPWPRELEAYCQCRAAEACRVAFREIVWDSPLQRQIGYSCEQYR